MDILGSSIKHETQRANLTSKQNLNWHTLLKPERKIKISVYIKKNIIL